jgi:elongation factor Ts
MATITADAVKELRERTGAGMMDCKNALVEADGDLDKAVGLLRERGLAAAAKKAGRDAREGIVSSYIHAGGKLGALIEVNCETDFVARTDEFQKLVRDLAMQVVALSPLYVDIERIPEDALAAKKAELAASDAVKGKPPRSGADRRGQLKKWYQEVCLYERPFRDEDRAVGPRHGGDLEDRREHPGPALHPLRARGGAVSDATAADRDGSATSGSC